jgi:hypothetical protein
LAVEKTPLLNEIAEEVSDYGEWDSEEGGFLERKLFNALDDLWVAHQWRFKIAPGTISTVTGTLGPYETPDDFDGLVNAKAVNKGYAYDAYGIPPPIPDDSQGNRYPIILNEVDNTISFLIDPGTGDKTLYYLTSLLSVDAGLLLLPETPDLRKFLVSRAAHYTLAPTSDFADQAKTFWEQSKIFLDQAVRKYRKGTSRPDTRTPRGVSGNPLYYGFQT